MHPKVSKNPFEARQGGDVGSIEAQDVKSPLGKFPPTTAVQIDPANTVTHSNRALKVLFAVLFKQTSIQRFPSQPNPIHL